jgi:hypothetical protein
VTVWCKAGDEYAAKLPVVWQLVHGAVVGMWFAGLPPPVTSLAKVGVVV